MKKREFRANAILGGPTVGKTTLIKDVHSRLELPPLLDADNLVSLIAPNWFNKKYWRIPYDRQTQNMRNAMRAMGNQAGILLAQGFYLLGNMYGERYNNHWLYDVAFLPSSPEVVAARSIRRGGEPIQVSVCRPWFDGWKTYLPGYVRHAIVFLCEDEYISDYASYDEDKGLVYTLPKKVPVEITTNHGIVRLYNSEQVSRNSLTTKGGARQNVMDKDERMSSDESEENNED